MEFEELRRRVEEHINAGVDPVRLSRLLEDYHKNGTLPGGETREGAIISLLHEAYAAAKNKKDIQKIAVLARALHNAAQAKDFSIDLVRREYRRIEKQYYQLERQHRVVRLFKRLGEWNIPLFSGVMGEWARGAHEALVAAKIELLGPIAEHKKVREHLL